MWKMYRTLRYYSWKSLQETLSLSHLFSFCLLSTLWEKNNNKLQMWNNFLFDMKFILSNICSVLLFSITWHFMKDWTKSVMRIQYIQVLTGKVNRNMHTSCDQREKNVANSFLPKLEPVNWVAVMLSFWITTSLRRSMFFRRELASFSV